MKRRIFHLDLPKKLTPDQLRRLLRRIREEAGGR